MCSQPTYQRQSSFFPNLFHHICILLWTFHEGQLPRFPQRWEQPKPHICCQATCANWEFVCCLVICCLVWAACLFLWAGCEVLLIEILLKDAFVTLWTYRNYRCLWWNQWVKIQVAKWQSLDLPQGAASVLGRSTRSVIVCIININKYKYISQEDWWIQTQDNVRRIY